MNYKKPLILNYKTFIESTGLDYAKGTYVSHPSPDAVKAKLAKIVENPILLDRTPVLKTAFPMAWRILFTFVIQVLGGYYSSTEQGLEASGSLPQKRKKPKSKKTPTKTQVTPPTGPTKGSEQSHSVSSGNVHDPQDPKRNKQLAGTTTDPKDSKGNVQTADKGLSSTVSDEGTVKTTPLLEGTHGDKYLEGFKPPADMEPLTTHVVDPSGTDAKYQADQTQSARLRYRSLTKNEGKTSSEVEPDSETLQLKTFVDVQALLLSDDEMVQESDEDDTLYDDLRASIEEVVVSYADLRASIKGYYDENVDHRDQTDKLVKETIKIIDSISKAGIDERSKPLKALNRVFETLEADSVLKEEMKKMVESYNTTSGNLSRLTELINNAKLPELLTKLEGFQSTLNTLSIQCASISESLKEDPEFNQRLLKAAEGYI
ncbi:hypothetical protein Tco_0499395 [Tanacetum coccineum]